MHSPIILQIFVYFSPKLARGKINPSEGDQESKKMFALMLTSAILLRTVHKYSEIWQIPHFYEILRDKIQDKDFNLFL